MRVAAQVCGLAHTFSGRLLVVTCGVRVAGAAASHSVQQFKTAQRNAAPTELRCHSTITQASVACAFTRCDPSCGKTSRAVKQLCDSCSLIEKDSKFVGGQRRSPLAVPGHPAPVPLCCIEHSWLRVCIVGSAPQRERTAFESSFHMSVKLLKAAQGAAKICGRARLLSDEGDGRARAGCCSTVAEEQVSPCLTSIALQTKVGSEAIALCEISSCSLEPGPVQNA